jgi:DNA-binding transcriptional regulator YdaS (Cro superfamily)
MKSTGRPTTYTTDHALRARMAWEIGATDAQVAFLVGVSESTLARWCARYPDMAAARAAGRDDADTRVTFSLYRRAVGYEYVETRILLPFGAKEPLAIPVTRHKHGETNAAFRWLALRKPAAWAGRAGTHGDTHDLADRLAEALANVARDHG